MQSLSPMPEKRQGPFARPLEWQSFFHEGSQFLDLAARGSGNHRKFNAEALYNILAMAVEKHFMALFLFKNYMPEGHTLNDLLTAAAQFIHLDMELVKGLSFMDSLQDICSVHECTRKEPTDEEIKRMIVIARRVKQCVGEELGKNN